MTGGVSEIHGRLLALLEEKAVAVAAPTSGSYHIGEFSAAKSACLDAGIPADLVQAVISRIADRRRS